MKSLLRCLCVSALALGLAVVAWSDEKKADIKKPAPFANMFTFPKTITLTDEQQKKVEALKTEYTPRLEEFKKKTDAIMTPDRAKAQKEAIDKAKTDGKKGKDLNDAGLAALKLSDSETKELAETKAAQGKLMAEINKKKAELLTDEQKKELQPKAKPAK